MIKMFSTFRKWCAENNIRADHIEITISPLNPETAAQFENAWHREAKGLTMRPAAHEMPVSGTMYGIPFRYNRPAWGVRPFGVPGDA